MVILRECTEDEAILAHEQKHLDQIAEYGWLKWYWRYIFDIDFRRQQEAEGYAVQWKIEEEKGSKYCVGQVNRDLFTTSAFHLDDDGMAVLSRLAEEERRPLAMMATLLLEEAMAGPGSEEGKRPLFPLIFAARCIINIGFYDNRSN